MSDKIILVFYIGIADMNEQEVAQYVHRVQQRFFSQEFIQSNNAEIILLPTRETNSRIECINPKYITDAELIKEHHEKLTKMHNEFQKFTNEFGIMKAE